MSSTEPTKFVDILLVEDNPADADLTRISMKAAKILNHARLHHVVDGEEAMAFLRKEGKHAGAPLPDLILLDLNIPLKSGYEVLEEIKADPALKHIPVIILTSSEAHEDILKSYRHYASGYVQKPVDLSQFIRIVEQIDAFWLSLVKLPSDPGR